MTTTATRDNLSLSLQDYFDGLVADEFVSTENFAEQIAAEQTAASAATIQYIVFWWLIADILDPIKMISNYKGKNAVSQDKMPMPRLDDLSITDDEDVMLNRLLKKAAADVYSQVAPYGKGITGGYLYDPDVPEPVAYDPLAIYNKGDLFYVDDQLYLTLLDDTPVGTDPDNATYFTAVGEEYNTYKKIVYTINYNINMDPSMIQVLDQNLEDALVKNVLYNWYRTISEPGMLLLAKEEYDDAISKVRLSIWYRKTLTRRRTELI